MAWQRGVMAAFFVMAVVLLSNEHESQFLGMLPYLLLLACAMLLLLERNDERHESRR